MRVRKSLLNGLQSGYRSSELTQKQALERGVGKSTLYYLRKHAKNEGPFKVYKKVADKLR